MNSMAAYTLSLSPSLTLTLSLSLSHPLTLSLSHSLTLSLSHAVDGSLLVSMSSLCWQEAEGTGVPVLGVGERGGGHTTPDVA